MSPTRPVLSLLFIALICRAAVSAPGIRTAPSSPRPGDAIFVTLSTDEELAQASCTWMKKSYDLLPAPHGYELVLPVSAAAKPGGYHLDIAWRYAEGGAGRRSVPVTVRRRAFGVQRLRLSASQEKKYRAADTKREYQLIGAALNLVTPARQWHGNFLMPIRGRVSTAYGLQRYVNGHFDYRHKGMDIAAPLGSPLKAAADGVVSLAEESFLLHGKTIILDHGEGVATLYLHLSEIAVSPGEEVKQGQVIGRIGATGAATGPHLHYAVYVRHEAVDPLFWTHLPAL